MNQAGFTKEMHGKMWAECVHTATMIENVMPDKAGMPTAQKVMYKVQPNWLSALRTFGEMAVLTKITTGEKLDNHGLVCIFVGCSGVHPRGTYHFVNLETNRVVHSRDIRWFNKTWGEWHNLKQQ